MWIIVILKGFEPLTTDSESVMMPFHHKTIKNPFNQQTERVNILDNIIPHQSV